MNQGINEPALQKRGLQKQTSSTSKEARARPGVRVHVASFNTSASTELCIRSLRQFAGYPFELVVGDSGSTDSSLEILTSFALAGWLSLEVEAGGRKHAEWLDRWVASCPVKWAVFVDSDVEFLRSGWLAELVEVALTNDSSLVGGEMIPEYSNFIEPVGGKAVRLARRLAPWLLLVDVEAVWGQEASFGFRAEETTDVPEGIIAYDVGAWLLRTLASRGFIWTCMPLSYHKTFRHYGGLSWLPIHGRAGRRKRRALRRINRRLGRLRRRQVEPTLSGNSAHGAGAKG